MNELIHPYRYYVDVSVQQSTYRAWFEDEHSANMYVNLLCGVKHVGAGQMFDTDLHKVMRFFPSTVDRRAYVNCGKEA